MRREISRLFETTQEKPGVKQGTWGHGNMGSEKKGWVVCWDLVLCLNIDFCRLVGTGLSFKNTALDGFQTPTIFETSYYVFKFTSFARWWFQICVFSPLFEEDSQFLTNIFQRGWNHQLVCGFAAGGNWLIHIKELLKLLRPDRRWNGNFFRVESGMWIFQKSQVRGGHP